MLIGTVTKTTVVKMVINKDLKKNKNDERKANSEN